jgi:hypothetical protein
MPRITNKRGVGISNPVLPITLYDVSVKKAVGIFKNKTLCAKYIFGDVHQSTMLSRITQSVRRKSRIHTEEFIYTARMSNEEQKIILGDKNFVILNGYKEPKGYNMM